MAQFPAGDITFLFTDIEGSTRLWEKYFEAMQIALARHDHLLRKIIENHNGYVFKTAGDAFCAAFPAIATDQALAAAVAIQRSLPGQNWGEIGSLKVRIALHTGPAQQRDNDYFGPTLNRVARLLAITYGEQILVSSASCAQVKTNLPPGLGLRDLGEYYLKDLNQPEHIFQLNASDLPVDFPAPKARPVQRDNLPAALTSFIGRQNEIAEIQKLLATTRLLTLAGAGGVGKTRLSIQLANMLTDEFQHGCWQVELATINDATLLTQTIIKTLGLQEDPQRPLLATLLDFLREKHLLLLLDNCEHLITACVSIVGQLLLNCPRLVVLVTSREPLNISAEVIWRVPSLSLPTNSQQLSPEELIGYEAIQLFVERVRSFRADFKITPQNVLTILQICQRLDGIPLALELAATHVKIFSVEQILARLNNRFKLLTGGNRAALPRQQTLLALVDWSYDLLPDNEQLLWQYFSVFSGGWSLEAACEVCKAKGLDISNMPEQLTQLVGKSVVQHERVGEESRYNLLETIRQYGLAKLATKNEEISLRHEHLHYFTRLAEETEPHLRSWGQVAAYARLETEQVNIRAALDWAYESKQIVEGMRLANAMGWFWGLANYWNEATEQLTRFLTAVAEVPLTLRAMTIYKQSFILSITADTAAVVIAKYEEGLRLAEQAGDSSTEALILIQLAPYVKVTPNNLVQAEKMIEKAWQIFEVQGDKWGLSSILSYKAVCSMWDKDFEQAKIQLSQSLELRKETGDMEGIGYLLGVYSTIFLAENNYGKAMQYAEDAIAIYRKLGRIFRWSFSRLLLKAGEIAWESKDYKVAENYFEEALPLIIQSGDKVFFIYVLLSLAGCRLATRKPDTLETLLRVQEYVAREPQQTYPATCVSLLQQLWEKNGLIRENSVFDFGIKELSKEQLLEELTELHKAFTYRLNSGLVA